MVISDIIELLKKYDVIEFKREKDKVVCVAIKRKKILEWPIK